jgi:tetratricopeptide (TPR) repeat protein
MTGEAFQAAAAEIGRAAALQESGRLAEALVCLERAVAIEPAPLPAFQRLAVLLCTMRRFDEAEAVIARGLESAPTDPELSITLGGIHLHRADHANAKLAFARALANAPRHARALHGFGTALLYEGNFEQAAQRFRRVLADHPTHARAGLDLAHCLLELGRCDEAIACLRSVIRHSPHEYGRALRTLVTAGRGRFWIRPSQAAAILTPESD